MRDEIFGGDPAGCRLEHRLDGPLRRGHEVVGHDGVRRRLAAFGSRRRTAVARRIRFGRGWSAVDARPADARRLQLVVLSIVRLAADLEVETPQVIARLRLAPELEDADFGERHGQPHRELDLPRLASVAKDGDERRVFARIVRRLQRHDVARAIGSHRGAVERERDRPVRGDGEGMLEADRRPLVGAA